MKARRITSGICGISLLLLPMLTMFSCGDEPLDENNTDEDVRMVKVSGDGQSERVNAPLPLPLTVKVTNILQDPLAGKTVTFTASGASVSPSTAVTDDAGLASCYATLGADPGNKTIGAECEGRSVVFSAEADEVECSEENVAPACAWPAGHIFITTTSSSYISGSGSVLIDFDPSTGQTEKVLETSETILDLAFSPRGELFLTTAAKVFKVDPAYKTLQEFYSYPSGGEVEIAPNYGSVLCAAKADGVFGIYCQGSSMSASYTAASTNRESLAADPITHDLFYITGVTQTYNVNRLEWDGRSSVMSPSGYYQLTAGSASPSGMCADSLGYIYITLDGNDTYRRIARIDIIGDEVDDDFFDFYAHGGNSTEAGRWGDLTVLNGYIYIIDKRNDRLVQISEAGEWVNSWTSDVFSEPISEAERYGIQAVIYSASCPSSP